MMRKKNIIIILLTVLAIIAIVYLAISVSREKKIEKSTEVEIGSLPIGESRKSILSIENTSNPVEINDSYGQYVEQDVSNFPSYEKEGISTDYPPSDKSGKLIDLDSFFGSVNAKINPKVRSLVGSNYYGLFYCVNEKNKKEYGVAFDVGEEDPNKLKKYSDEAKNYMRLWEPYLLKDLRAILFPKPDLSEEYLNQKLVFNDGKYRFASVNLPDGKSSISYAIKDSPINRIYVTTSQECMEKALN